MARIALTLLSFFFAFAFGAKSSSFESDELISIKKLVKDPKLALNWSKNTSVCEWSGINCSLQGHVIGIQVSGLSLSGSLQMSQFLMLSRLQNLSLSGNNFTISFSHLNSSWGCSLESLDMSLNRVESGSIPMEFISLCKSLKFLNLSRTGLLTSISIKSKNLDSMDLSHNNISGELSASTCEGVKYLDLSYNMLSGHLPEDFLSMCNKLQELSLAENHLTGAFPPLDASTKLQKLNISANNFLSLKVHHCSSLNHLDASYNNISGTVFLDACPTLSMLNLSDNAFSGSVLGVFGNLEMFQVTSSLKDFKADHNKFTGSVPTIPSGLEFMELSCNYLDRSSEGICPRNASLKSLVLVYNKLAGPFLESVMACKKLEVLVLSMNSISGEIPPQLCKSLPFLQHLVLWGNQLQGNIPATLDDCSNLVILDLSMNNLQGTIPRDLSRLKSILLIFLNNNNLSGTIPPSLGSLETLAALYLGHNHLQGEIPVELRNCTSLIVFEVNENRLTGQIPGWIGRSTAGPGSTNFTPFLIVYAINSNSYKCKGYQQVYVLKGIRYEEFQKLAFVTKCANALFLFPPGASTPYRFINSPQVLDLSFNNFSGSIPTELGGMVDSLYVLNLASNSLSGEIPESLGNLKNIERLDLSFNSLDSQIPESFSRLTFMKIFNVSNNNLYGVIPQAGQLQAFPGSSFEGNPRLCGMPLDSCNKTDASRSSATVEGSDRNEHTVEVRVALISGAISCILWAPMSFFWKGWWFRA